MIRKELRRDSDAKERILDGILSSRVSSKILEGRAQIKRYLSQYFADVPVEDLQGRSEKIMAVIALEQLEFAATRKKEQLLLRIFNPTEKSHGYQSSFTIIEMVNDDMPFLVDSVSAAIARQDLAVHITVHPVIRVVRDGRGRLKSIQERSDKKGKREIA